MQDSVQAMVRLSAMDRSQRKGWLLEPLCLTKHIWLIGPGAGGMIRLREVGLPICSSRCRMGL